MSCKPQPLVVIACEVMRGLLEPRLPRSVPITFMSYDYHVRPKATRSALQQLLDELPQASRVIIGYGLCGNGIAGLEAGPHTLFIPRMDDCIAMMMGSYDDYMKAFQANPGTYYLNKGWLESGNEPLSEYQGYVKKYGQENADMVMNAMYGHYDRICLLAFNAKDIEAYRPRAQQVAAFCTERWGMIYEERVGTDDFISGLVELPNNPQKPVKDYLVIMPDNRVDPVLFRRDSGRQILSPQPAQHRTTQ